MQCVPSVQRGKATASGFWLLPTPAGVGAYGKYHRAVESLGSEAKHMQVQVQAFLFTGPGVLYHCLSFTWELGNTLSVCLYRINKVN